MVNKRYYWLKLQEAFFTDKRIKRLRKIAGGDTYTIIYLKLLLLSLQDEGKLYFDNVEDSFIEELALELDEDEDNVQVTINYLIAKGMLEIISDDEYFLTELPAMIGSETASARRVRKSREKSKIARNNENLTKALHCNTDVTECNKNVSESKSIDIELDIDSRVRVIDKEEQVIHNHLKKYNLTVEQIKTTIKLLKELNKDIEYLKSKIELMKNRNKEVKENFGYLLQALKEDWKPIKKNNTACNINHYKTKFHNFEQSKTEQYSEEALNALLRDRNRS